MQAVTALRPPCMRGGVARRPPAVPPSAPAPSRACSCAGSARGGVARAATRARRCAAAATLMQVLTMGGVRPPPEVRQAHLAPPPHLARLARLARMMTSAWRGGGCCCQTAGNDGARRCWPSAACGRRWWTRWTRWCPSARRRHLGAPTRRPGPTDGGGEGGGSAGAVLPARPEARRRAGKQGARDRVAARRRDGQPPCPMQWRKGGQEEESRQKRGHRQIVGQGHRAAPLALWLP